MLRQIFSTSLLLALVRAQDQGLFETLNTIPELSELVTYIFTYPELTVWLQGLYDVTFLAPSNDAFAAIANFSTPLPTDEAEVEELISYHTLDGTFYSFNNQQYVQYPTAALPTADVNETMVTGGDIVIAIGSTWSSAVAFTSGNRHISQSFGDPLNFTGGVIYIVDSFLTLPQTFKETANEENMLGGNAFANAVFPVATTDEKVTIDDLSDVTIFLPIDYSLESIGNVIENMTKSEFDHLVSYHVVNEVLDIDIASPPSGYYQTYANTGLTIFSSNGFVFVNNARIVGTPNWLFRGGAIYSIYGVLNPNNITVDTNASDAQIAFAGAEFTPNFTFPTTDSRTTPVSSPSAIPSSHSGGLSTGAKAGIGAAFAAVLILAIGFFFLTRQRRRSRGESGIDTNTKFQHHMSYPMKDLEGSVSHEELVANAARPAKGPIKHLTPSASVYSLERPVKETSI